MEETIRQVLAEYGQLPLDACRRSNRTQTSMRAD